MNKLEVRPELNDQQSVEYQRLWKAIGYAIREIRRQHHLSQEELCMRAGLNRTYISDIERGGRNASIGVLYKISGALGLPLWRLIQLSEQAHEENSRPKELTPAEATYSSSEHAPLVRPAGINSGYNQTY